MVEVSTEVMVMVLARVTRVITKNHFLGYCLHVCLVPLTQDCTALAVFLKIVASGLADRRAAGITLDISKTLGFLNSVHLESRYSKPCTISLDYRAYILEYLEIDP